MGKKAVPLDDRTVGVVHRVDEKISPGYTLFNMGRETYLIDEDGRVVHEWRSARNVFVSYLLPNGNLLRDGSENTEAPCFRAGGASGFVEEVTWDGELVWSHAMTPYSAVLSHHDLIPLPNGRVLVHVWERKTKDEAVQAGRRPDLIPDGEVWNEIIVELEPDGKGEATVVWTWSMWDHLVQDYDPKKDNFGDVAEHPELMDINFCVPGGKAGARNRSMLPGQPGGPHPSGLRVEELTGSTGEKDWMHINSFSYDAERDQIVVCSNVPSEIFIIDHGTTTGEARTHRGGNFGKGGDFLFRFGNRQAARRGSQVDQELFCPHNATFVQGADGSRRLLVFNNGRAPDRLWSSVEEHLLPEGEDGVFPQSYSREAATKKVWSYGPKVGKQGSFYCTHISGSQRLPNGNTVVTQGPQGIIFEVTPSGEEVWRYISPVMHVVGAAAFVRQGDFRTTGRFSLFLTRRYAPDHPGLVAAKENAGADLTPGRHLEA